MTFTEKFPSAIEGKMLAIAREKYCTIGGVSMTVMSITPSLKMSLAYAKMNPMAWLLSVETARTWVPRLTFEMTPGDISSTGGLEPSRNTLKVGAGLIGRFVITSRAVSLTEIPGKNKRRSNGQHGGLLSDFSEPAKASVGSYQSDKAATGTVQLEGCSPDILCLIGSSLFSTQCHFRMFGCRETLESTVTIQLDLCRIETHKGPVCLKSNTTTPSSLWSGCP